MVWLTCTIAHAHGLIYQTAGSPYKWVVYKCNYRGIEYMLNCLTPFLQNLNCNCVLYYNPIDIKRKLSDQAISSSKVWQINQSQAELILLSSNRPDGSFIVWEQNMNKPVSDPSSSSIITHVVSVL